MHLDINVSSGHQCNVRNLLDINVLSRHQCLLVAGAHSTLRLYPVAPLCYLLNCSQA